MALQQFHTEENQMYIARNDYSKLQKKQAIISICFIIKGVG